LLADSIDSTASKLAGYTKSARGFTNEGDAMKRVIVVMAAVMIVSAFGMHQAPPASAHNPDPNDPLQIAIPVLKVKDVAAAMKYYNDVLGFAEEFKTEEPLTYAGVARGKVTFHLSSSGDEAIGKGTIYLIVKSVDKLHEEVARKGATVTSELTDRPYGMREFAVRTPDGHLLIFAEGIEKK
jgi:catechol 2,3-dioxygenase-like lactoylglutathione lyase family enzyme